MMASNLQVVFLEEISLCEAQNTFDYDTFAPEVRIVARQFQQECSVFSQNSYLK